MATELSIRPFEAKRDLVRVNTWAMAHGKEGLPFHFLPPSGVIVEDGGEPVAAAWLYKCLGVGVAFMEHVHTRPGLSLSRAREAIGLAVEYFRFEAREDDYGVIFAHTSPALAREAKAQGWQVLARDRVTIARETGLDQLRKGVAA